MVARRLVRPQWRPTVSNSSSWKEKSSAARGLYQFFGKHLDVQTFLRSETVFRFWRGFSFCFRFVNLFWRFDICIQEMYAVGNQCEVKGGKDPYRHLLFYFRLMASMVVQHRCLCSSLKGHCGCWGAGTPCQCQRWGHELGFLCVSRCESSSSEKRSCRRKRGSRTLNRLKLFLFGCQLLSNGMCGCLTTSLHLLTFVHGYALLDK